MGYEKLEETKLFFYVQNMTSKECFFLHGRREQTASNLCEYFQKLWKLAMYGQKYYKIQNGVWNAEKFKSFMQIFLAVNAALLIELKLKFLQLVYFITGVEKQHTSTCEIPVNKSIKK